MLPAETPTATGPRRLRLAGMAALLAITLLAGCGGGDDDDDASAARAAKNDAKQTNTARSADPCPLTAEQVSTTLRATVDKDEASCTFSPADDNNTPSASFNRQHAFICDAKYRADQGYDEKLDGLNVDAYAQPDTAIGSMILVCAKQPFEVTVDMAGGSGPEVDAAKKLAALVLAGE